MWQCGPRGEQPFGMQGPTMAHLLMTSPNQEPRKTEQLSQAPLAEKVGEWLGVQVLCALKRSLQRSASLSSSIKWE